MHLGPAPQGTLSISTALGADLRDPGMMSIARSWIISKGKRKPEFHYYNAPSKDYKGKIKPESHYDNAPSKDYKGKIKPESHYDNAPIQGL